MVQACALYNNWWPMLAGDVFLLVTPSINGEIVMVFSLTLSYAYAALMYVLVPMPCLFFGGGSTQFLTSRDGGG
jgi:hypothetical protein